MGLNEESSQIDTQSQMDAQMDIDNKDGDDDDASMGSDDVPKDTMAKVMFYCLIRAFYSD